MCSSLNLSRWKQSNGGIVWDVDVAGLLSLAANGEPVDGETTFIMRRLKGGIGFAGTASLTLSSKVEFTYAASNHKCFKWKPAE
jgi:hypothetical protein